MVRSSSDVTASFPQRSVRKSEVLKFEKKLNASTTVTVVSRRASLCRPPILALLNA